MANSLSFAIMVTSTSYLFSPASSSVSEAAPSFCSTLATDTASHSPIYSSYHKITSSVFPSSNLRERENCTYHQTVCNRILTALAATASVVSLLIFTLMVLIMKIFFLIALLDTSEALHFTGLCDVLTNSHAEGRQICNCRIFVSTVDETSETTTLEISMHPRVAIWESTE